MKIDIKKRRVAERDTFSLRLPHVEESGGKESSSVASLSLDEYLRYLNSLYFCNKLFEILWINEV